MLLVCCVAILVIIAIVITTVYIISYRQRQKKKHNFGIKKFKSSVRLDNGYEREWGQLVRNTAGH